MAGSELNRRYFDTMTIPVLGVHVIMVYQTLQRFVWRNPKQGSKRLRQAVKEGVLAACVTRNKLRLLTGLSLHKVQQALNTLRAIGWIEAAGGGQQAGEASTYALGRKAHGGESYFADDDVEGLWEHLQEQAQARDLDIGDLPCDDRRDLAAAWYQNNEGVVSARSETIVTSLVEAPEEGVVASRTTPQSEPEPPPSSDPNLGRVPSSTSTSPAETSKSQGSKEESTKSEEYPSRATESFASGEQEQDDPDEADDTPPKRTSKGGAATFALDEEPQTPDRFASGAAAMQAGADKADLERVKRQAKKDRRGRTKKVLDKEAKAENLKGRGLAPNMWTTVGRLWGVWRELMHDFDPDLKIASWLGVDGDKKARGQIVQLVKMYDGDLVETALRYVVGNWEKIQTRFFKAPQGMPGVGFVLSCHESLFKEAQVWAKHHKVLEEMDQWRKHNPTKRLPPSELRERHRAAERELSALGFGS